MIIPVFLICLLVKTTFTAELKCPNYVSCHCGISGKNATVCAPDDKVCAKLSHCETCDDRLIACSKCPKDFEGPLCSEEIKKSREKRQNRQWRPWATAQQWRNSCWILESPKFGGIHCTNNYQQRICTAQCLPGYRFSDGTPGEMTLTCNGGVWTPRNEFPECEYALEVACECQSGGTCDSNGNCVCPADRTGSYCETALPQKAVCRDPGFISNGFRRNMDGSDASTRRSFQETESVMYSCESEAYTLRGLSHLQCRNDGTWSSALPKCVKTAAPERKCPDPGQVDNAERLNSDGTPSRGTQEYRVGQSVVYTCLPGFALQRRSLITCLASGSWSYRTPSCRRVMPGGVVGDTEMGDRSNSQHQGHQGHQGGQASSGSRFCRDPGVDPNGSRLPRKPPNRQGFPAGTQLKYTCNQNYELTGNSTLFCFSSGDWSGSRPRCEEKLADISGTFCTDIGPLENGHGHVSRPADSRITDPNSEEYPEGTSIQYSCNSGYVMEGQHTLICEPDGYWSDIQPTCKSSLPDNYCVDLGPLENGHAHVHLPDDPSITEPTSNEYPEGTNLHYSCNSGYKLEGTPTIACEDGFWSGEKPSCKRNAGRRKYCPSPGDIQNGNKLYIPSKERRRGPQNPQRQNERKEQYEVGCRLQYSCNSGYDLEGPITLKCEDTGRWSAEPPKCIRKIKSSNSFCKNLGPIFNGHGHVFLPSNSRFTKPSENEYPEGTRLQYSCDSGYLLEGESDLICEEDGLWSDVKPYCQADQTTYCKAPPKLENGKQVHIMSPKEKKKNANSQSNSHSTSHSQSHSHIHISDGNEEERFHDGCRLEYTCNAGYKMEGPSTITCGETGSWSDAPPKCVKVVKSDAFCKDLGPIFNGHGHVFMPSDPRFTKPTANKYPEGTRLQYSCESGYVLEGEADLICERDGLWSDIKPSCKIDQGTYCPPPAKIWNGNVEHIPGINIRRKPSDHTHIGDEEKYPVESQLQYSCNEGYKMKGPIILTCEENGRWSSAPPKCRKMGTADAYCKSLGALVNGHGHVFLPSDDRFTKPNANEYPEGTRLQYSCDSGYTMEGEPDLICEEDGFWSDIKPNCKTDAEQGTTCPSPGEIENGNSVHIPSPFKKKSSSSQSHDHSHHIGGETYTKGCKLQYSCNAGYVLDGPFEITCQETGTWTAAMPRCIRGTGVPTVTYCTDLGPVLHGQSYVHLPSASTLTKQTAKQYPGGTRVHYSCDSGYKLGGQDTLTCMQNGLWSDIKPSCIMDADRLKYCPALKEIENGNMVHVPAFNKRRRPPHKQHDGEMKYPAKSELHYSCKPGYDLEGPAILICEETGTWSVAPPKCLLINPNEMHFCNTPEPLLHGKLRFFSSANNKWSVKPENVDYDTDEFPAGALVEYICDDGYRREGEKSLTCLRSGSWSGTPPICIRDCGISYIEATNRVFMGEWANTGQWPWVVSISAVYNNFSQFICGGAVLDSQTVLTAGHCLFSGATSYILRFGKYHFKTQDDDPDVEVRKSTQVIIHPKYFRSNSTIDNDIGLVMFQPKIRFSPRVQPICLPTTQSTFINIFDGKVGFVSGWGETENDAPPEVMMMTSLPVVNFETCIEVYRQQNLQVSRNMFCAGYEDSRQTVCNGDSGSPLVFYDYSSQRYTVEGLVSFGKSGQCGKTGKYAIFTKVCKYISWINEYIEETD